MSATFPRSFGLTAALALVACGAPQDESSALATAGARTAQQEGGSPCGSQVTRVGEALLVMPSGAEDTVALQCALDHGGTVRLAPGLFRIAQVVANGFVGQIVGAGEGLTTITNVDRPLQAAPVDFILAPPSAENPWPVLLTFVDGRFGVSHLTIHVTGPEPTTPYSALAIQESKALFSAICITGTTAVAAIDHVTVQGEESPSDPVSGLNLLNAIDAQKFLGADPVPLALRLAVRDSTFVKVASGVPVGNLRNADVSIVGNLFEGTLLASEVFDVAGGRYRFVDNVAHTRWAAIFQYDVCQGPSSSCGLARSTLLIAGNQISGGGVALQGTFGEDVRCKVVGNSFGDMDPGGPMEGRDVYLGEGTRNCLVTGAEIVEDHGTNNRVRP